MALQINNDIRAFHQALHNDALAPTDAHYVEIVETTSGQLDPIMQLAQRIIFAKSESVNLLTGFRGNGKSTQLKRLKQILVDQGHRVLLIDIQEYLLLTKPLEISDFLLSLIAAIADEAAKQTDDIDLNSTLLERIWAFLKETEIEVDSLKATAGAGAAKASFGLKLKRDTNFKKRVQSKLRGHLDGLVSTANDYITQLVDILRGEDKNQQVVVLVDSLEQLRGIGEETEQVYDSVVELFSGQASNLQLPMLHMVYTVPPFLIPRAPQIASLFGGNPVCMWPNIPVRKRDGSENSAAINVMLAIVQKRYENWSVFFSPEQIKSLAKLSGGDIRDFFRLIRESLLGLSGSLIQNKGNSDNKVSGEMVTQAVNQLRREFMPLPSNELNLLKEIHQSKKDCMSSMDDLPLLTRFLDFNRVMNYVNGDTWYDIHPVLVDLVKDDSE